MADKVKKVIRDQQGPSPPTTWQPWSWSWAMCSGMWLQLASELELDLEDVARANLDKLASRAARNVIAGSGDDR